MPNTDFSKNITVIYNSNLPYQLKNDVTCRLVCEQLQAANVSIILYDGKTDKLFSKGSYLNPERSHLKTANKELETIINDVSVFEFFQSEKHLVNYSDFIKSSIYGKTIKTTSITEMRFEELYKIWNNENYRKAYKLYKDNFQSEFYDINKETLTGEYFLELINSKLAYPEYNYAIIDLSDQPESKKNCFKNLENIFVYPAHSGIYIAVPIFFNDRYTGILRLIFPGELKQQIHSESQDFMTRIKNFAQLISLHLETNYLLEGYRTILTMDIDTNNLRSTVDTIQEILNCKGVMLRQRITDDGPPEIIAFTETLSDYYELAYSNKLKFEDEKSKKFSTDIMKLFERKSHSKGALEAITFSIDDIHSKLFKTVEFSFDNEKNLKKEFSERVFDDFEPVYNSALLELNIKQLIIASLKYIDEGFFILTNTKNHKFTKADVELIILLAKRVGLELKHKEDIELIKENEKQQALIASMRLVVHQVGALINASSNTVDNFAKGRLFPKSKSNPENFTADDLELIRRRATSLGFMINQAKRQLFRTRRILEFDTKPIIPVKKDISVFSFLKNRSKDFEAYAYSEKKIHIWVTKLEDTPSGLIKTDEELMEEVIYNLLENAVKYSFGNEDLRSLNIGYDELSHNSNGNIQVKYRNTFSALLISITNWGFPVKNSEKKLILEKFKRGSNAANVVGSGIGLYLVNKIILALGGSIKVESTQNSTSVQIEIAK